jgi:acetylglutamate kinase
MTTDTVPKTTVQQRRRLDGRRHGQGRRHAGAEPGHDARRPHHRRVADAAALRRRAASRRPRSPSTGSTPTAACPPTTPCCCWPTAPAGSRRRPRSSPRRSPRPAPTWRCSCSPTPRAPPRTSRSPSRRGQRGRRARPPAGRCARNNLLKTALFGNDPNWGRVLAAIGTTDAAFEPDRVDVRSTASPVCRGGAAAPRARASTSPAGIDHRRRPEGGRSRRRSGPTTCPILRPPTLYSTCLRPRELGVHPARRRRDEPLRKRIGTTAGHAQARPRGRRARSPSSPRRCRGSRSSTATSSSSSTAGTRWSTRSCRGPSPRTWCSCATAASSPVVVHGGGPQITAMLDPARHRQRVPRRPAGHHAGDDRRRPDGAHRPGRPELVGLINQHGPFAVGLSGEDGGLFTAERTHALSSTASRSTSAWSATSSRSTPPRSTALLEAGHIPVVATVAPDADGVVHNVNADTAAAALAVALGAVKLVVLTDVEGLYADWPDRDSLVSRSTPPSWPRSCRPWTPGWSRRWRPACARSRAG